VAGRGRGVSGFVSYKHFLVICSKKTQRQNGYGCRRWHKNPKKAPSKKMLSPGLTGATYGGLCGMPACGQAVGCGVCDTPELWCGAAGLCARVRTRVCRCRRTFTYIHTYIHNWSWAGAQVVLRRRGAGTRSDYVLYARPAHDTPTHFHAHDIIAQGSTTSYIYTYTIRIRSTRSMYSWLMV